MIELERLKREKLENRAFKHPNQDNFLDPNHKTFNLEKLFYHWIEESQEFIAAYNHNNSENMKEELADISNMLDMMFETVVRKEREK